MNYLPGDYVSTRFGPALVVGAADGLVHVTYADGLRRDEYEYTVRLLYPGPEHGGAIADAAYKAMAPVRKLVPHWDEMEKAIADASAADVPLTAEERSLASQLGLTPREYADVRDCR